MVHRSFDSTSSRVVVHLDTIRVLVEFNSGLIIGASVLPAELVESLRGLEVVVLAELAVLALRHGWKSLSSTEGGGICGLNRSKGQMRKIHSKYWQNF